GLIPPFAIFPPKQPPWLTLAPAWVGKGERTDVPAQYRGFRGLWPAAVRLYPHPAARQFPPAQGAHRHGLRRRGGGHGDRRRGGGCDGVWTGLRRRLRRAGEVGTASTRRTAAPPPNAGRARPGRRGQPPAPPGGGRTADPAVRCN